MLLLLIGEDRIYKDLAGCSLLFIALETKDPIVYECRSSIAAVILWRRSHLKVSDNELLLLQTFCQPTPTTLQIVKPIYSS